MINGDYIKAGHTWFLIEAVKGKTLKELKEQHPDKDERIIKNLHDQLKVFNRKKSKK